MLRKAVFILRLAGQDIRGNVGVHLVGAAIIAAAFLTLGLFLLLAATLDHLARHWEEKIQLAVYLDGGLDDATREGLRKNLAAQPEVAGVNYTSPEAALAEFKLMLGKDSGLLEGLDENPLPASFTLKLTPGSREADKVRELSGRLGKLPGVAEVDFGEPLLESWQAGLRLARGAALLIGGMIVLAVVFIISNTIRLTMYSRREEIGIMRLVGASNLLIRLPFILEGMLQGGVAALLGCAGLWLLYYAGLHGLHWPGILAGFSPVFIARDTVLYLFAAGVILGAAGSLSRLRDFLKV